MVADDIVDQVSFWRPKVEDGTAPPELRFRLCDEDVVLRFTEKHLLDLQVLLESDV